MTQICYLYLSRSWVCFYGRSRDPRETAETYKASRELGSELAHHHLHQILLAKACHKANSDEKDGKTHSASLVRETAKSHGKECGHKRGSASEKLGLFFILLLLFF